MLSASCDDDKIAWYENDGDENFTAHTITTSADGATSVYAADVDDDGDMDVFSFYLEEIRKILAHPENFIQLNESCLRLSDMRIKVDDETTQPANDICFTELDITNVMKRVVTTVRYNREDISCEKQPF